MLGLLKVALETTNGWGAETAVQVDVADDNDDEDDDDDDDTIGR